MRFLKTGRSFSLFLGVLLASECFFLIGIQNRPVPQAEERHYIPAARDFLQMRRNRNIEHPPLAKFIMAIGIAIAGDNPLGWRLMSTLFGALTVAGMFALGFALFNNLELALAVSILSVFDFMTYVQARSAMLDTFMMAFIVWALVFFWEATLKIRSNKNALNLLIGCGTCLGLATACKWFGVLPWIVVLGFLKYLFPKQVTLFHFKNVIFPLVALPLLTYFITFLPLLFLEEGLYDLSTLLSIQWDMFQFQKMVGNNHPFRSVWYEWMLSIKPYWYSYPYLNGNLPETSAIISVGNPIISFGGLFSVLYGTWFYFKERALDALFLIVLYTSFTFCWILVPHKDMFYYYYYPAFLILDLTFVFTFSKIIFIFKISSRWIWTPHIIAIGFFVYFYPILAGQNLPPEQFFKYFLIESWRY